MAPHFLLLLLLLLTNLPQFFREPGMRLLTHQHLIVVLDVPTLSKVLFGGVGPSC